jgi:uncharacterized protein (DUF486 family)
VIISSSFFRKTRKDRDAAYSPLPVVATILLLTCSNLFMTIAWYGHLKNARSPPLAIIASWLIALLEYCFQVPANRIGYGVLSLTQLKILQEVITLVVFTVFAFIVFGQSEKWNFGVSYPSLFAQSTLLLKASTCVDFIARKRSTTWASARMIALARRGSTQHLHTAAPRGVGRVLKK